MATTQVLHGSWLPARGERPARFAFWGEVARARRAARGRRKDSPVATRAHPFGASATQLRDALVALEAAGEAEAVEASQALARLPSAGGAPLPSPELALDGQTTDTERPALAAWTVEALALDAARAPALLTSLSDEAAPPELVLGDDLAFWIAAARFGLELLYRQRFAPALQQEGDRYLARWRPVLDEAADAQRLSTLAEAMPPVCRALAWEAAATEPRPRELVLDFLGATVDAAARQAAPFAGAPRPARRRSLGEAWLEALQGNPVVQGKTEELAAFWAEYRAWATPAGAAADGGETFRVSFRLDPPLPDPDSPAMVAPNSEARDWTLRYLLQATDDPSLLVPAAEVWRQRGSTARFLNRRLDNPQEHLLAGLGQAARLFPPVESSLQTARPAACHLTVGEAHEFVRETALLLQASGFGVLVPGLETKLGIRVRLGHSAAAPGATTGTSGLSMESLVAYDWQLALGGEPLSREEFEALARLKAPLVQVRGQWVELRPEQIEQALAFFQRQGSGQMALPEAIKLALAPDGEHGLPVVEVATEGWIDELLHQLRDGSTRTQAEEPPGFVGRLRPYQKAGVSWLSALRRFGLGGCLADDMGLGKTVEVIALLLHQRQGEPAQGQAPSLLICPTSVVGNWRRELARFAPGLRVLVHHGAGRRKEAFAAEAAQHDVVISTYALLYRDEEALASVEWADVVLDEAQNIKNAATKAAQVARKLAARWRAALTGTPVENRLSDLWSIFQFLNPGYLGSAEAFRKRFALPIERAHDEPTTARLKTLVTPFILRRVKTDRAVIQDLPEKNEMKVYCTLTREQATLYEAVVQESLREIEESEGVQRRGQILATLTKLKQVCNHPALFLHDRSALPGRSGKLARLGEMLEEVLSVDERALVFTQYAEMGKLLKEHLEATFGREALFLYGSTPAAERDRMVARFQAEGRGPHLFILSIKAGGTGLNLTRANHVFHFDRWWNPAVENQATDRAFRIGQTRNVQVHKFLCAGTFEEALDQIIERKIELSQAIVGTSEAWITEMSTDELRSLFALRGDAVEDV